MNRHELEKYIAETYGAKAEYPWIKYPTFAVFRHKDNQKWFAVIMTIDKRKLGIKEDGQIDVVNVKCEPFFAVTMREQRGIYPAYHMNKDHWLTLALDGSVSGDNLELLLALSFDLTDRKNKR